MPAVARPRATLAQPSRDRGAEFQHPAPYGLVGDLKPALGQQFLDIAVAQGEAEIEPDRVLDHLGREPMTAVAERSHTDILPDTRSPNPVSVTMPLRQIPCVVGDRGLRCPVMGIAAIGGWGGPRYRTDGDDLSGTLLLHKCRDCVARIDRPEQVHFRHELQKRRIEGAGLGVHGPTTTAACIRNEDIHSTPLLYDPPAHPVDRLPFTDIHLL